MDENTFCKTVREINESRLIFARRLAEDRETARLTTKECAELIGISSEDLERYENESEPFPREYYAKLYPHIYNHRFVSPSEDKYGHVRTLIFYDSKRGMCEDLYRMKENGAILVRQRLADDLVRWTTCWHGEADTPIKDGMTLNVVDKKGNKIFSETTYRTLWNGCGQADKAYPFSWEK